ncbi:MAG: hypothetical protein HY421_02865 [Candidatus Kerfeldbacteria bacterium]|nr:hypothetical protein [Candidatus Kerfeldbacteria bacterium]
MDWRTFITIAHIVGTVLGVGGATFAEVFHRRALRDGKIDESEGGLLSLTYGMLRLGIILLVLSGFAYFLLLRLGGRGAILYEPRLWAKLILTVVILVNALLMATRKLPVWVGGSISIVSWYAALILGVWRGLELSLVAIMAWYVGLVLLVALIFRPGKAERRTA